jgi:hypothetical protein
MAPSMLPPADLDPFSSSLGPSVGRIVRSVASPESSPPRPGRLPVLPWYLLGGLGIAVAVEGFLGLGVWPLNILAGVFLFNAAYELYSRSE